MDVLHPVAHGRNGDVVVGVDQEDRGLARGVAVEAGRRVHVERGAHHGKDVGLRGDVDGDVHGRNRLAKPHDVGAQLRSELAPIAQVYIAINRID